MKYLVLLWSIFFACFDGISQKDVLFDSRQVIELREKNDSAFFRADRFDFDVTDFLFDTCHLTNNSFRVSFEIRNRTNKALITCSDYIRWYDACGFKVKGAEPLLIPPHEKKTVVLEVVLYNRKRLDSEGALTGDWNGRTMYLPFRVNYQGSKKGCSVVKTQIR